jgi:hypothetical protein
VNRAVKKSSFPRRAARRGLSLLETLMLVTILGIVGAGSGLALQTVAKTPSQTDTALTAEATLVSKMEQMKSVSFDNLTIGDGISPYSTSTIRVSVAYWDPTGGNSPSTNFKRVTVTSNGVSLMTLVNKP